MVVLLKFIVLTIVKVNSHILNLGGARAAFGGIAPLPSRNYVAATTAIHNFS